jgi:hypothetical protein
MPAATAHKRASQIPQLPEIAAAIRGQRRSLFWVALLVYLPAVLLIAFVSAVAGWKNIPFTVVSSDPATTGRLPFYAGILSNIGVLAWCGGAAVALFSAVLLRRTGGDGRLSAFLFASGFFGAVLLVDDLFLVHEIVFPYYLGLPQQLPIVAYGVSAVLYLAVFARTIAGTDFLILLTALAALGVSVLVDQLPFQLPMHLVWEDGAKLIGATGWCAYLASTSARALQLRLGHPTAPAKH